MEGDHIQITATINNTGGEVASGVIASLNLTSSSGSSVYDNFSIDSGYEKTLLGNIPPLGSRTVSWNLTAKNAIPETTFHINVTYSNAGSTTNGTVILNGNSISGWDNRKQKTINGTTAGAQTNYQVNLTVYNTSGTDTPGVLYLNGSARSDFGDLRFTKSDGVTLLDYWIESYTSGVSAVVWVEVDSIPANPNTVDIYLYYGNPSATSASSGANTFVIFDDFNRSDGAVGNGWTVSGNHCNIYSNYLKCYTPTTFNDSLSKSLTLLNASWEWKVRFSLIPAVNAPDADFTRIVYNSGNYYNVYIRNSPTYNEWAFAYNDGKIISNSWTPNTAWHAVKITRYNGIFEIFSDGSSKGTKTDNRINTNAQIQIFPLGWGATTHEVDYDVLRVRKYVSPEPTLT